jgi:hypothetical protein
MCLFLVRPPLADQIFVTWNAFGTQGILRVGSAGIS